MSGSEAEGQRTYPITVHQFATSADLGAHAGRAAAEALAEAMDRPGPVRLLLAAAPSQRATLHALAAATALDGARLEVFHMDDYIGLPHDAPQAFANWLEREFLGLLPRRPAFHRMQMTLGPQQAAASYAAELGADPFDLVLCGIGVNGHIAFNEPGCDFADPEPVRVIEMDTTSRQQQVDEGHFPELAAVPTHALTLTIPRVLHARHVICSVPGAAKRAAVQATLAREPSAEVPATALKLHPSVDLYVDQESCPS